MAKKKAAKRQVASLPAERAQLRVVTGDAGPVADGRWEPSCDDSDHAHAPVLPAGYREAAFERAAGIFRAVGEVRRLRLLELLTHGGLSLGDIAAHTGEGMSTVSMRLRVLRAERLVRRERRGKNVFYALADEHVTRILQSALEHAEELRRGPEGEGDPGGSRAGKADPGLG